ncbi:hypothetical protein AVEN_85284-1 [Araneus ventricosus]|uniref:Uncharacterized protein n=1 Tax=Araneus ventricosus TaxID=182803 RepID=A0A4Y2K218_ARAVE|nr:hypothetical protein AVEN_85284-1 [Araneus ventricosus]
MPPLLDKLLFLYLKKLDDFGTVRDNQLQLFKRLNAGINVEISPEHAQNSDCWLVFISPKRSKYSKFWSLYHRSSRPTIRADNSWFKENLRSEYARRQISPRLYQSKCD